MIGRNAPPSSRSPRGIALRGVRFGYRRPRWWEGRGARDDAADALVCPHLDVVPGLTLLLGPNGAGKSTLLKLMAGVEAPVEGTVAIDGHDLWREERAARRTLAYVPEQPDLTPYAALGEVMRLVASLRGVPPASGMAALAEVGLAGLERRSIRELSMGQRRRAMLAAALIGDPTTLLLDEPLEAMDRAMRDSVLAWLEQRLTRGGTAVVSTHEIEPFASRAGAAIVVRDGRARMEPLDPDPSRRMAALDRWARGS